MKTVSFALALSIASTARATELFELKNSSRLQSFKDKIHKQIETLVHVKTFDEIPIFGGKEYRRSILEQQRSPEIGESSKTSNEKRGLTAITKDVGCSIA